MRNSQKLAAEFVRLLAQDLTPSQMREVRARNAEQTAEGICHSHDFCDANMVMDQAFQNVMHYSPLDDDQRDHDDGSGMSAANVDLWNSAHSLATHMLSGPEMVAPEETDSERRTKQIAAALSSAGWRVEQTGGGCTAWEIESGADGAYMMVTDGDDGLSHEITSGRAVVGLYDADGDCLFAVDGAVVFPK